MDLDRQVQILIENAPDIQSQLSVAAIAPVLQQVAATLGHSEYYICQSQRGEWLISTLRDRQHREIQAVYAFGQVPDLRKSFAPIIGAELTVQINIIQLLFEVLATPEIDRIIFVDRGNQLNQGREVARLQLEALITERLRSMDTAPSLPPDLC